MNIEERYNRSVSSSHLRAGEMDADVDMLIAAGLHAAKSGGLGFLLWRAKAEYDRASRLAATSSGNDETAMLAALMEMKTLPELRGALGRLMVKQATLQKFMEPDDKVLQLVPRVLQAFLHPQCFTCGGRKTVGEFGRAVICKRCAGTGLRRPHLGETAEQRRFCLYILCEIDRKVNSTSRAVYRYFRQPSVEPLGCRSPASAANNGGI